MKLLDAMKAPIDADIAATNARSTLHETMNGVAGTPLDLRHQGGCMTTRRWVLLTALLAMALSPACDRSEKGACVYGSGISATCGDDFTDSNCATMNGRFYEGQNCTQLGFE